MGAFWLRGNMPAQLTDLIKQLPRLKVTGVLACKSMVFTGFTTMSLSDGRSLLATYIRLESNYLPTLNGPFLTARWRRNRLRALFLVTSHIRTVQYLKRGQIEDLFALLQKAHLLLVLKRLFLMFHTPVEHAS